jgi:activator of 2-hydroxyglutaryl-CoA dehydratase
VFLGIDVGTYGVKAVLVNETCAIVATWRRKTSSLLWLREITERVVKRIEPQSGSDPQQQFESVLNRYV